MRKITIEEIEGIWVNNDKLLMFELIIRPYQISFFNQVRLADNSILFHKEGVVKLVDNIEEENISIWIGDNLELIIWQLNLENDEIIVDIADKGRYRMKKN